MMCTPRATARHCSAPWRACWHPRLSNAARGHFTPSSPAPCWPSGRTTRRSVQQMVSRPRSTASSPACARGRTRFGPRSHRHHRVNERAPADRQLEVRGSEVRVQLDFDPGYTPTKEILHQCDLSGVGIVSRWELRPAAEVSTGSIADLYGDPVNDAVEVVGREFRIQKRLEAR